jgi:fucose permease
LPQGALGALLAVSTAGYMLASFAAGWLLRHMRLGGLLALSCFATAASLLGYASAPTWAVVVAFGSLAGLGAGAIDAGINAYVASQYGPRTVNWLHACYGIGAASGPLLMGAVLMHGRGWERGYVVVGLAQLGLAAAFAASHRAWPSAPTDTHLLRPGRTRYSDTLRLPIARWSMAAFFVYTGLEAAVGAWCYSLLTLGRGFPIDVAAFWVSAFWVGLSAGRIGAGAIATRLRVEALLALALAGLALGAALVWLAPVRGAELIGLALLGLAAGPIFPTLIAATPGRVGAAHAANAIGFQIAAAALGQSLLPAAIGIAAGAFGVEVVGPGLLAAALALGLVSLHSAAIVASSERRTLARAR